MSMRNLILVLVALSAILGLVGCGKEDHTQELVDRQKQVEKSYEQAGQKVPDAQGSGN